MRIHKLDCLLVIPNASEKIYQGLAKKQTAIETPTWALLLAGSLLSKGYSVEILDCDAERLTDHEAVQRIAYLDPLLALGASYGQNPNSGTTSMTGIVSLAEELKSQTDIFFAVVGTHVQALPVETLEKHDDIDAVFTGEGVLALPNLIDCLKTFGGKLSQVKGIAYREWGKVHITEYEQIVKQEELAHHLPYYAWNLLPYKNKPFDLYRSYNWHANWVEGNRSPAAALYTSFGCLFSCSFCVINVINRTLYGDNISAKDSRLMRLFPTHLIIQEIDKLMEYGVRNIKISDEMFFLHEKHYFPLLTQIKEKYGNAANLWSYSRVNTTKQKHLELFKSAGMNWLALGIEAANQHVREEISKGVFKERNIREVVKEIRDADISVMANYIFGLPDDNFDTMQETHQLSLELNTEGYNAYGCAALPGSPLYLQAKQDGIALPKDYSAWSFLSYDALPMPTKYLTAAEVLKFRDESWLAYHTNPVYLKLIEDKFGPESRQNIEDMTKIKLRRKLLGD